jgi:aminopeptidase N
MLVHYCHRFYTLFLLGFAFVVQFPMSSYAQRSGATLDFYKLERQNWIEHARAPSASVDQANFDVRFYHLNLNLSISASYVQANVICSFDAIENNTTSIKLNLRREFTIDSIRGNASGFNFSLDTISVTLDRVFQAGDSGSVQIYYRGVPPVANGVKGLRYVTHAGGQPLIVSLSTPFLAHYWWPCKEGPGDKPDSVFVDITIPDTSVAGIPVVALSNGVLMDVIQSGGMKTFQWRERYPIVPYYVMVAVSNYRDFHQTFTGTHGDQFSLDYYVFDESLASAQLGVADLPAVIELFSGLFGVYPFSNEKYGMTELGFYGAIENQTNTIINTMDISWFGVSVHELAHMWFGDMITCTDWHHGWLNEGFASYCEALWVEHTGGFDLYKNYMQGFKYQEGGTVYLQDISDPFGIFVSIIYDKGAYVLHMLRGVLGDSLFFASMSDYASNPNFRYRHATTEDFQAVCETTSQQDLDFFFEQWIYDEYYPMYGYNYTQSLSTGETNVFIRQMQADFGRRPVFTMPIELRFLFQGGGDTVITVWNDQQTQTYTFTIPEAISGMEFDPNQWILSTSQVVAVGPATSSLPAQFSLEQNYPNPFNGVSNFELRIAETSLIRVVIYDLLGKIVRTLVDEVRQPGIYRIQWDSGTSPSGLYLCRFTAGPFSQTRKVVLVR